MVASGGNDRFNGRFDPYIWSAPYYENPGEVLGAIRSAGLEGKKLKAINLIGYVETIADHDSVIYSIITDAGIKLGDEQEEGWSERYPHLDDVKVPKEVEGCEPIQFIFDDDTSLEIRPLRYGGARISQNTIPFDMRDGINRNNFDCSVFFKEALGEELRRIYLFGNTTSKAYVSESGEVEDWHKEIRSDYTLSFQFGYHCLEILWDYDSWFTVRMDQSTIYDKVPYKRIKEAAVKCRQVPMIPGPSSGGYYYILPSCISREESSNVLPSFGESVISVDEMYIDEYLYFFLAKHFDNEFNKTEDRINYVEQTPNGEIIHYYEGFQSYEHNYFSFAAMRDILDDIKDAIVLLQSDFNNPRLFKIKKNFYWMQFSDKPRSKVSARERNEMQKKCVPEAIDFYERFVRCVERMMEEPGCDCICFSGP